MSEAEWVTSTDLEAMLMHLGEGASRRKLVLLGCAIQRPVVAGEAIQWLTMAERYAEGELQLEEVEWQRTCLANEVLVHVLYPWLVASGDWARFIRGLSSLVGEPVRIPVSDSQDPQTLRSCALVRDIFGNPFRPAAVDRSRLASDVVTLAQTIYDERAFERMPVLADAVQDAGCDDAAILQHCRQPGEHVHGCWVVDLLLGKE
jgi:hypothetical protein